MGDDNLLDLVTEDRLICQAIQLDMSQHTERTLALSCAQFRGADSIEQWFDLLARTIAGFQLLYIVIDLEAVGSSYLHGTSWLSQLAAMFQRHASRKWISQLKILLIGYDSMLLQQDDLFQFQDVIVPVRQGSTRGSVMPWLGQIISSGGVVHTRAFGILGCNSGVVEG